VTRQRRVDVDGYFTATCACDLCGKLYHERILRSYNGPARAPRLTDYATRSLCDLGEESPRGRYFVYTIRCWNCSKHKAGPAMKKAIERAQCTAKCTDMKEQCSRSSRQISAESSEKET